ncbi:nucleotidyl cyclase domain-containing protein [Treponema sp. R80B11-R83G3]
MEIKNKKSGNSSPGGSIIAAICIVIYLFALVQGAVRIYLSIDGRKITAEQEFSGIADVALSVGNQGFMNDRFINTINNALTSTKSLEALIITGPDGGNAFEKRPGHAIAWVNNEPRFKNKFYFLNENLYKPLAISDLRNANIKGVANAFDYPEFIKIMKETLFLILIGFAVSFFTLLIQSLLGKGSKHESVFVPIVKPEKSSRVIKDAEPSGPKGLYSSRSGIGWEEYLKDRLDSELHRCSSSEKDLALLIMDFTDISEERVFRQAAEEAVTFFTSRDLLFEYGESGISVILPGTGFDAAVAMSEKFYKRITERFPKSYSEAYGLCIGLSARSGRLCNASRLILEAMEALKKAKSDSNTSIIAFKSDPDKYRAFIASQK